MDADGNHHGGKARLEQPEKRGERDGRNADQAKADRHQPRAEKCA